MDFLLGPETGYAQFALTSQWFFDEIYHIEGPER